MARRTVLAAAGLAGLALAGCTPDGAPVTDPPSSAAPQPSASAVPRASEPPSYASFLLATLAHSDGIARINPENEDPGAVEYLTVGAAPWGIGVHAAGNAADVATAEGLAVLDLATFTRLSLVPYLHPAPRTTHHPG